MDVRTGLAQERGANEILLRKLFQTLLLEMANRHAAVQSADIPLWLVEGMSAHLQANQPGDLHAAAGPVRVREHRLEQRFANDAQGIAPTPALAFQQLSWPQESDLTAEGLPLYRSCAQLFLEELLRFDDGRACLRSMIGQLAEHWNWQTAFLLAFHSHFDQVLDVEKWWSVELCEFRRGLQSAALVGR
jgi:hypothetical protein